MDYQIIADRIELALTSLGAISDEELRELAEAYAKACQEVNQRLQDVHHLIKAGERSEAIRRADIPPRLLDAVEALDLPDRDAWVDICTLKRLPPPPEFLSQYVAELNEAYENEQGLAGLLRQHRLLALAQAPLAKRAEVLRQLVEAEPDNPVWVEDLQNLEKFWLDQLSQEIQQHLKSGNIDALEDIKRQLETENWRVAPSPALVAQCRAALETLRLRAFRNEMLELASAMLEALQRRDLVRVEEYVRIWQERAAANPQWVDWELQLRVQPALVLSRQLEAEREADRRRRQLFQRFQQLLVQPTSLAEVQQQYLALKEAGVALPPDVQQRYDEVVAEFLRKKRVRRNIILAVAAVVVLVVAGIIWEGLRLRREATQAREAAATLDAYREAYDFEEANSYLAGLEKTQPSLLKRPEVIAAKTRLEEARQQENVRQKKFAEAVQSLEASLSEIPSDVALKQATSLARTAEEKSQVELLRQRAEQRWGELRAHREEGFRKSVAQVAEEVEQVLKSPALSVEEELQALTRLMERVNRLETENRQQGLSLDREISQIKTRIQGRFMEVSQVSEREKQIRDLCSAAAQGPEAYLALVRRLSRSQQTGQVFSDLSMVEAEMPFLEPIANWNQASILWNQGTTELVSDVLKTLVTELGKLQVEPGDAFPWTPRQLQDWELYVKLIGQREMVVTTALSALYQEWRQPLISDAWLIRLKNGRRYYSLEQPIKTIKVVRSIKETDGDPLPVPPALVAYQGRAPQTILFNRIGETLAAWSAKNWETSADKVLGEIVQFAKKRDGEAVEPPLLFHLFYETLSVAKDGDIGWRTFHETISERLRNLRDQYPASYDWPRAAQEMDIAYDDLREFFDSLPDGDVILNTVQEARKHYRGMVWPRLEWVGILLEDDRQVWYVRPIREIKLPDGKPIFVAEKPPNAQGLFLRRLGTWKNPRGVVESRGPLRLYNGRPVLAFVEPD